MEWMTVISSYVVIAGVFAWFGFIGGMLYSNNENKKIIDDYQELFDQAMDLLEEDADKE